MLSFINSVHVHRIDNRLQLQASDSIYVGSLSLAWMTICVASVYI